LLAAAIYHDVLPFTTPESVYFKRFIDFIAPGFQLASRQAVAGSLLDSIYAETQKEVVLKLQEEKKVTLGCDGSSDGCQEPITHVIAITKSCQPFLLREVVHRDEEHSASNILTLLDADVYSLEQVCCNFCCIFGLILV
jgi:hypothetical protein